MFASVGCLSATGECVSITVGYMSDTTYFSI